MLGNHPSIKLPTDVTWSIKLGAYIGNDLNETYRANISDKMKSIKHLLNTWKQRKRSLPGKVLIIKSLAICVFIL